MKFWKYQGTGNDFVMLNNYHLALKHSPETAQKLCDRHFGIGSDGLIVLEPDASHDFRMIFYNPDGSKSFCGNGSRCAVRFARDQGIINGNFTQFTSTDGTHDAHMLTGIIDLSMHDPVLSAPGFEYPDLQIVSSMLLNTGSPHLVLFLDPNLRIDSKAVRHHGAKIRYGEPFRKDGVNVNFVNIRSDNQIQIRTYERGVEDETLSCGTGVTASAIAYHALFKKQSGAVSVQVDSMGGPLEVKFLYDESYRNVRLCGPAEPVYSGEINL